MVFKIKVTDPKRVQPRPAYGSIAAGGERKVGVRITPPQAPLTSSIKDKMQVTHMPSDIGESAGDSEIKRLWKETEAREKSTGKTFFVKTFVKIYMRPESRGSRGATSKKSPRNDNSEQSFASTSDGAGMTGGARAAAVVGNTSKTEMYKQMYDQKLAEFNQLINYTMKLSNEYETLKAENDGKDVSELRKELKESQEQSAKLRKELESARGDGSGKDAAGRQKRSRSKGGINLEIWELALLIVVVAIVFRYYV